MDDEKQVSAPTGTQETAESETGADQVETQGTAADPGVLADEAAEEQATGAEGE